MKSKAAAGFLKYVLTVLSTMAKTKTRALKSKTRALKTRLVIFSLLHSKKILMSSISQKFDALMGQKNDKSSHHDQEDDHDDDVVDKGKSIVLYNCNTNNTMPLLPPQLLVVDDEEQEAERFSGLTHSKFDHESNAGGSHNEKEEFEDAAGGSVIDLVKLSKEEKGEEFRLEDDIDRVADLFIERFHRQMWMQKQLSLKGHQGTGGEDHLLNIN
ncbi:hypothetical protein SLE2022_000050 [Rubroshorea leprosula]